MFTFTSSPGVCPDIQPGQETYVCFVPFYHIYGILVILYYGLYAGNTMVVHAERHYHVGIVICQVYVSFSGIWIELSKISVVLIMANG